MSIIITILCVAISATFYARGVILVKRWFPDVPPEPPCAWCGPKPTETGISHGISHGICSKCVAKMRREIEQFKNNR